MPEFVRFDKPEVIPILKKAAETRKKLIQIGEVMNS